MDKHPVNWTCGAIDRRYPNLWRRLVLTVVVVAAASCSSEQSKVVPSESTAPMITFADEERIEIQDPDWMAADDRFVYLKLDSHQVLRLDPETARTLAVIDVGGGLCQGIGASYGAVWTCTTGADDEDLIVRIDPDTDAVVATIDVPKARQQGKLDGGFGRVWIIGAAGDQLIGIDPTTNQPDPPIPLPVIGSTLAVGPDGVWVVSSRDKAIIRVDPTTRTVTGRVDDVQDLVAIDASSGIWAATQTSTVQIDPISMKIARTVPFGTGPDGGIFVSGSDLWIRAVTPFLTRIDTATGQVIERYSEDVDSAGSVLVAFGAIWASAYDDHVVIRHPLADG